MDTLAIASVIGKQLLLEMILLWKSCDQLQPVTLSQAAMFVGHPPTMHVRVGLLSSPSLLISASLFSLRGKRRLNGPWRRRGE